MANNTRADFVKKAVNIDELLSAYGRGKGSRFAIEDTVELEDWEFEDFSRCLLKDRDFITERLDKMKAAEGVAHCILVKAKDAHFGILVESSGFSYARYAAYYECE